MTYSELKPRLFTRLLAQIPPMQPDLQHAPSTISTTNIVATTMAAVVPTIIPTTARIATATAATATSVGTDDELGPAPIMIHYTRIL